MSPGGGVEPGTSDVNHSLPRRRPFGVIVIIIIQLAAIMTIGGPDLFRLQLPI